MSYRLLPEYCEQAAVILAWPSQETDWADILESVQSTYLQVIEAINQAGAAVILLVKPEDIASIQARCQHISSLLLLASNYNDTWTRDYCFLTLSNQDDRKPIEFLFNGWGGKYDGALDNRINQDYLAKLLTKPIERVDWVFEGGAIEIDENGLVMSTASCLLNSHRNGDKSLTEYEQVLKNTLGATQVNIFNNGHLTGDDTDGHIDTLVRYCGDHRIVIQGCSNRPTDSH